MAGRGAIVHEWVEQSGGAEQVVDAFLSAFPDADLYALWTDAPERFDKHVQESWIARTPLRRKKALALPFLLPTWRQLTARRAYDWMLVSSHLFAHHARFSNSPETRKFVYAHTPARYIWSPELDRRGDGRLARAAAHFIRPVDRHRAKEADSIAANSEYVRARIEDYWERDARVIYPPVNVDRITARSDWAETLSTQEQSVVDRLPSAFLLGASRFIPYKRLDLVIAAGASLGIPVVVAGRGPEEQRLRELATDLRSDVTFVISPSDSLLFSLYQRAHAFVFPVVEDFGIMPVEAMAAGCPVIAPGIGGTAETVVDGESGSWMADLSLQAICDAVERVGRINRAQVPDSVARFRTARFVAETTEWIGV